jgi:hypothetical protein
MGVSEVDGLTIHSATVCSVTDIRCVSFYWTEGWWAVNICLDFVQDEPAHCGAFPYLHGAAAVVTVVGFRIATVPKKLHVTGVLQMK